MQLPLAQRAGSRAGAALPESWRLVEPRRLRPPSRGPILAPSERGAALRLFGKELSRQVVVVAEIGNNHEGNVVVAEEMIRRAADAGADAVKLQTFVPERYVSAQQVERLARLRGFQLRPDDHRRLKAVADRVGIPLFSTPFDLESAELLAGLCDVFKVASGDITFRPLLDRIASFGKPVLLSTGLATSSEVALAKGAIETAWERAGVAPGLVLLHCVSSYPVPNEQANLAAIGTLLQRFGGVVGYSDHTIGIDAAVLAVGAGARVIEKHFTLAKDYSDFRDHQLSADPDDMKELVRRVAAATAMMGSGEKVPQPCEEPNRSAMRRSIRAARDLPAGHRVTPSDIVWVRPGDGLEPGREREVLGSPLDAPLRAGDALTPRS